MPSYEYVCDLQGLQVYMDQDDYIEYRSSLVHVFRSGLRLNVFEDNAGYEPDDCRHFWLHIFAPSAFSAVFVCICCDAVVEYASSQQGHH